MSKRQLKTALRQEGVVPIRMTRRAKRDMFAFLGFTFPNFFLLGVFVFWPILYSLYLSFFKWNMIAPKKTFIGLDNFQTMFNDPVFWLVTKNTLILAFFTVVVKMAIALGLALALNKNVKGRSVYRAIIFSPTFTTSVAVAMVWGWIFNPNFGLLRVFMRPFGIPPLDWLESVTHSLPAVIIVLIWSGIGYDMVLFLAGLKNISLEIYDAALVDGVSPWQNFWYITFPLLSPTTFFLTITGFIGALKAFDIVAIMTDGGPLNTSNVIVHFLYQNAFQWFKTGYASALALILFVIIMAITLVQNRLSRRWVHY
ncbi:MAG: sugar ABC transporter permease [Sphaerochaetaceae bacterium]|nr:sugar ABC transporter permease [Sphaerochaetaceae bacterium]NLO61404.1 sugar ABC transporter permease [Spirochaetales bacterium]MDD2406054.1 sugar ABC transporter permease [Sphaerochaetaceae bacterium]MDD4258894.1 sugar ABC transporter permease [Sphaerochaetaceae bacterium]MDD4762244.1 sugar ABC transporter permease [Sphaerochaetaceae bacterium]